MAHKAPIWVAGTWLMLWGSTLYNFRVKSHNILGTIQSLEKYQYKVAYTIYKHKHTHTEDNVYVLCIIV